MTWLTTFYLRAFAILLQVALIVTDEEGDRKPFIIQSPQDMTIVASNSNVTITCISSGSSLKTTWQKDDRTLDIKKLNYLQQSPDGSLYILFSRGRRDAGRYKCIVSNKIGTVFSREAHITFPYMKNFSKEKSIETPSEGSREILRCHAPQSYPDKHIYWSKINPSRPNYRVNLQAGNDAHYYQIENGDLYFSFAKMQDNGGYICNIENQFMGKVKRRLVQMAVSPVGTQTNQPPKVWYLTSMHRAMKGERFVLECVVSGRPVPSVKLYKEGSSTIELGSRSGNGRRHVFTRFKISDAGSYICEATNVYGKKDSKTTFIGVSAKPEWRTHPRDETAEIDKTANLRCKAFGVPEVTYEWFYNGNRLSRQRAYTVNGGNLTIESTKTTDSGMYQCVAKNRFGSITVAARLQVREIPAGFANGRSTEPQPNVHALIGKPVELTCNPTGAPKPTVEWRHENEKEKIKPGGRFSILRSGNLKIKEVKKADEGNYKCTVRNNGGHTTREGRLSVRAGIAINVYPQSETSVIQKHPVNLTCGVQTGRSGILEVSFQWKKFGTSVKLNDRVKIIKEGPYTSVLRISEARQSDTGLYSCVASCCSGGSKDEREGYLTVVGAPSRPTSVTLTDRKEKEVQISWTLGRDNHSKVKRVYIQYRTTFQPDKWYDMKMSTDNQSRGHEIIPLSPWASYKFRVISENAIGNSTPSAETDDWLRTIQAAPSKYPKGIKSKGSGPTELMISWQPLPKIEQNAPGIYYIVSHRQSGSQSNMLTDKVDFGKSSFVVKGAEYYVQYQFSVRAGNTIGIGIESPLYTGFTGGRLPLGNPTDLQVQITSSTTAVAWWRGVNTNREVIRGEFQGYKLFVSKGKIVEMPEDATYKVTRANKTTVQLKPWTSYLFQVVAYNKIGNGPGSNIVGPLQTPEDLPGEPEFLSVRDAQQTKANLTWRPPVRPNGVLVGYIINYKALTNGEIWQREVNASVLWITLTDLKNVEEYEFSVQAKTKVGAGRPMKKKFDFHWLPTSKPGGVQISAKGPTMILLSWDPDNTMSVIRYKVYYWSQDQNSEDAAFQYAEKTELTNIQRLQPGTTYNFQIASVNQYGAGPKTESIQGTTDPGRTTKKPITTLKVINNSHQKKKSSGISISTLRTLNLFLLILTASLLIQR